MLAEQTPTVSGEFLKGFELPERWKRFSISRLLEKRRVASSLRNEYRETLQQPSPEPLTHYQDDNNELHNLFAYLATTSELEFDTPSTQLLTGIAENMLAGSQTSERIQVVIIKRSQQCNAFVTADGTIFMTQALLNKCTHLDEAAAVIGHEVGHIINKTHVHTNSVYVLDRMSVAWAHEMAADLETPRKLKQAGYNSTALASIIVKIGSNGRDFEHQGALMRGSQNIGLHAVIDNEASAQGYQPIPAELHGKVSYSNLEILDYAKKQNNIALYNKTVRALHSHDFAAEYRRMQAISFRDSEENLKVLTQVVLERLEGVGYTHQQAIFILLGFSSAEFTFSPGFKLFEDVAELTEIILEIPHVVTDNNIESKLESAVPEVLKPAQILSCIRKFFNSVHHNLGTEESKRGSLRVSENELFLLLHNIQELRKSDENFARFSHVIEIIDSATTVIFLKYIYLRCVAEEIPQDQQKPLFHSLYEKYKGEGMHIVPGTVWGFKASNEYISPENLQFMQYVGDVLMNREPEVKEPLVDEKLQHLSEKMGQRATSINYEVLKELLVKINSNEAENLTDEKRKEYFYKFAQQIEQVPFASYYNVLEELAAENKGQNAAGRKESLHGAKLPPTDSHTASNTAIFRMYALQEVAFFLFKTDTDAFYECLEYSCNTPDIPWDTLSFVQVTNLCYSLLNLPKGSWVLADRTGFVLENSLQQKSTCTVLNYDRVCSLVPVQRLLELSEQEITQLGEISWDAATIEGFIAHVSEKQSGMFSTRSILDQASNRDNIYADNLFTLIVWRQERQALVKILEQFVSTDINRFSYSYFQQLPDLYLLAYRFLPFDARRETICRNIANRYLSEPSVQLGRKIDFLLMHFDRIGIEGSFIVGEHIHTIADYQMFREKVGEEKLKKILTGEKDVKVVALLDYATSLVTSFSGGLLDTIDDSQQSRRKATTDAAYKWLKTLFVDSKKSVSYVPDKEKFEVDSQRRDSFHSFADTIAVLRSLSPTMRSLISHKLLVDTGGALTTLEARRDLSRRLLEGLQLDKNTLQGMLLEAVVIDGKAEFIGFPAAQMIAPLLFRSLDPQALDYDTLLDSNISVKDSDPQAKVFTQQPKIRDHIGEAQARHILTASSRDLVKVGREYSLGESHTAAEFAGQSDAEYRATLEMLEGHFVPQEKVDAPKAQLGIDATTEALISAAESSTAGITRQLQLSTQFKKYPPELEARLRRTLDSNPGLPMLLAWENLFLWSTPEQGDSPKRVAEKVALGEYLQQVEIQKKIAGGSLNTIFLAHNTQTKRDIVARIQNPNAEFFVQAGYELVEAAYDYVLKKTGRKYAREVKIGKMLNALTQRWCIRDINDPFYLEDDANFRSVIASATQANSLDIEYYAPELEFTQQKFKTETVAAGTTANKFRSGKATAEQKNLSLEAFFYFFEHQLDFEKHTIAKDGTEYILVHSDQHLGNYTDAFEESTLRRGVIDRNMFLRLERPDLRVIQLYLEPDKGREFAQALVERILDKNKVRGVSRATFKVYVTSKLIPEYTRQNFSGHSDELLLLQVVFEACALKDMDIPLELQLMLRNAAAYKELKKTVVT
jgi:hypothetical protein